MTFGSTFGRTFSPTFQPKSQAAASNAWSPTNITGCLLWYDFADANTLFTDAGSTKVSADGDAIYQANDKSGNNFHAVQSASAKRPLYKTNIQNSLSTSLFDGAATNGDSLFYDLGGNAPSAFTFMAVVKYVGVSGSRTIFHMGKTAGTRQIFISRMSSTTANRFGLYNADYDTSLSNVTSAFYTITHSIDGSYAMNTYQNGAKKGAGKSAGGAFAGDRYGGIGLFRYGANEVENANAYIGEILVYNSGLSDTDRQSVETYLNNKWAIY